MEIKEAQADLKKRQEAVVEELNQVMSQQQQLAKRREELTQEALRLNGEKRLLNRLSDNGQGKDQTSGNMEEQAGQTYHRVVLW